MGGGLTGAVPALADPEGAVGGSEPTIGSVLLEPPDSPGGSDGVTSTGPEEAPPDPAMLTGVGGSTRTTGAGVKKATDRSTVLAGSACCS